MLSRGFTALRVLPAPPALATSDPLPSAEFCLLQDVTQRVGFSFWLLPLHSMHMGFLRVFSWLRAHFLCHWYHPTVWTDHSAFAHQLLKDGSAALRVWQL